MFRFIKRHRIALGLLCLGTSSICVAADTPTAEFALQFRPTQADVEFDIPDAATAKQCKVTVERYAKGSGWVLNGPAGQVLRRFVDSNDDKIVDQWRYYKDSVEVYRDLDTDSNKQVDQMRWFNTAGSRWGIDKNEDGRVDVWKVLSPEEAAREIVKALVTKDERLLGTLIVNADDLANLGLKGTIAESIQKNFTSIKSQLDKLSSSKMLSSKTKWLQFQGTLPSSIPADQVGSREDIVAHQNAMALVEYDGQTGMVQLGTLIRIGDAWKLTRMPQPLEGNSIQIADDGLFSPVIASTDSAANTAVTPGTSVNPKSQKLIEDLQNLDKNTPAPNASKTAWNDFNTRRTALLQKLVDTADDAEEREQWLRQIADGIAAGVQSDTYSNGVEKLKGMLEDVSKKSPKSPLVGYITYRIMTADYSIKLRKAPADKTAEVQEQWLKSLENFVNKFPRDDDAPEAMFQLGSTYEFSGKYKEARSWYTKLSSAAPQSPSGARAKGALARLDSKGQPFHLKGNDLKGMPLDTVSLKGKVVLVIYWANWSEPLVKDLPQLRAFNEQYHDRGLEIVGVNVDATKDEATAWIAEHKVDWLQMHEPGGLEGSPLAVEYGIIHLPSMFVLDRDGAVAYRGVTAEELKPVLAELLKGDDKDK